MIGVILAGGLSRRFKQDKALYYDSRFQKTWIELAVDCMTELTDTCYVVANSTNQQAISKQIYYSSAEVLTDTPKFTGLGPLSGIYTVAKKKPDQSLLITAVDYPFLSARNLEQLTTCKNSFAIAPDGSEHYTLAHLTVDDQLLEQLENALVLKELRLKDFLKKIAATPIKLPENELVTTNHSIH